MADDRTSVTARDLSGEFWSFISDEELRIQRCVDCGRFRHYPRYMCGECQSLDWEWTPVSGRGTVHSFTTSYRSFDPTFRRSGPYVVATIELEEGVRVVSDMDEPAEEVSFGAPVELFFDHTDERTLPRFRLVQD